MWKKQRRQVHQSQNFKPWYIFRSKDFQEIYSMLDGLFNDNIHNSLRWIYSLAKIDWTKKARLSI